MNPVPSLKFTANRTLKCSKVVCTFCKEKGFQCSDLASNTLHSSHFINTFAETFFGLRVPTNLPVLRQSASTVNP